MIQSINEASRFVIENGSITVPLSEGRTAVVTKIKWHKFKATLKRLKDVIQSVVLAMRADGTLGTVVQATGEMMVAGARLANGTELAPLAPDQIDAKARAMNADVDRAQAAAQAAFAQALQHVETAPEVLDALLADTVTGWDEKFMESLDFEDYMGLLNACFRLNFINNEGLRDFFVAVRIAFFGASEAGSPGNSVATTTENGPSLSMVESPTSTSE